MSKKTISTVEDLRGEKKKKVWWKTLLKGVGTFLGAVLLVVVCYLLYVLISYHRIPDRKELTVTDRVADSVKPAVGVEYKAVTYNIGFGAYIPDYSFFMDGGKESRARSKSADIEAIEGSMRRVSEINADFALIQEVDFDSTRSYHVNQRKMFIEKFASMDAIFAQNYDSPYLFYPILEPHGASKSGILTLSKFNITSSLRRKFPISTGFSKLLDLDRCYSVTRIPTENGKEIVLYNVHLSAYGNDASIREKQIRMLCEDMGAEYALGNYIICGGDYNHDLRLEEGSGASKSWAFPFLRSLFPEGLSFAIDRLTKEELDAIPDSCRDADIAYDPVKSTTFLVDGFIISDNIELTGYQVDFQGFPYSDHEPVIMSFKLME